jgi:hypothetical protein
LAAANRRAAAVLHERFDHLCQVGMCDAGRHLHHHLVGKLVGGTDVGDDGRNAVRQGVGGHA